MSQSKHWLQKRTVASDLMIWLGMTIIFTILCVGVSYYFYTTNNLVRSLTKRAEIVTSEISRILTPALFAIDDQTIRHTAEVYLASGRLSGIRIVSSVNGVLVDKPSTTKSLLPSRVEPIVRNNLELGTLELWFSDDEIRAAQQRTIKVSLIVTVAVLIAITLAIRYIMNSMLVTPLSLLHQRLGEVAEGSFQGTLPQIPQQDLNDIMVGVNRMSMKIAAITKKLSDSEKNYRELVESVNSIILHWDKNGKVIFINKYGRQFFGYSEKEIIGKHVMGTIVPATETTTGRDLSSMVKDILKHPEKYELNENENICSDGRRVYIQWTNRAIVDENGLFQEILSVGTDCTERKQIEEELRQAQKMEAIGTLAGGIAHDFNNILLAIFGFSELARLEATENTRLEHYLNEIFNAADRARELVQQILTFSRRSKKEKRPLQIAPLVKETLKMLRSSVPTTIEINQYINSQGTILADPTQVHQVLMNLSTNACHAMSETGGILKISASDIEITEPYTQGMEIPGGRYMKLEVSDTGAGMDNEIREKVFEPYFTTKEPGKGTGLGLAVIRGIIADHNGYITVESKSGHGSTFTVYLPIVAEKAQDLLTEKRVEPIPSGTERILFVDDELQIVLYTREALSKVGYNVRTFTNGVQALQEFELQPDAYDLVITDMTMPCMTGTVLARKILEIRPDIPVILCTGYSELVDEEKARAMGISEYLEKPVLMNDLLKTVRKVLDKKTQA